MVYGSIYGAARTAVSEGTFNPDYATPSAAMDMVNEALEIDQKFFDLFVEHDFLEAAAYTDVNLESTLMAVDESFLSDVWEKIRELVKKIKDKVVSIFKAAAVKIGAFFTRDNAALVSKYEKQFNNSDLSIMIKGFRKKKGTPSDFVSGFEPDSDFKGIGVGTQDSATYEDAARKARIKELEKIQKDYTIAKKLKESVKSSAVSEGGKIDYMSVMFDAAKDVKASDIASYVKDSLTNHQDAIKQIDTLKKELETKLDAMEELAKKQQDEVANKVEGNEVKDTNKRQVENKKAEVARTICSVTNACIGKLSAAALDAIKFNIKQCRAAYIKIASKGAPNVHESAELLEAMLDADEYEVDSFFEQYSYDYDELTA